MGAIVVSTHFGLSEAPSEGIFKHREKKAICTALRQFLGNRRQTAEALGISLLTLQYRLKELGLLVKEEP
jgi:DNA-binding NtrC family response regulator